MSDVTSLSAAQEGPQGPELDLQVPELAVPLSLWIRALLVIPVVLVVTVLGVVWLIAVVVPVRERFALSVGRQALSMLKLLVR